MKTTLTAGPSGSEAAYDGWHSEFIAMADGG